MPGFGACHLDHWNLGSRREFGDHPTEIDCPIGSGSPEKGFDGLRKPAPGCLGVGRRRKVLDHNEVVDFAAQEGVEEGGIVTE